MSKKQFVEIFTNHDPKLMKGPMMPGWALCAPPRLVPMINDVPSVDYLVQVIAPIC